MAGDWIKMRSNLWDDPRVARLCDATDEGEAAVIGALYWLWSAGDQHTTDGFMPGLSLRQIDRKTGIAGIGSALADIGWIELVDDGVIIVRFGEHNGSSAKKRAMTARRVANHKDRNKGNAGDVTKPNEGNADGVSYQTKSNAPCVSEKDKGRYLEEEEEKEYPPPTSSARDPYFMEDPGATYRMTDDWEPDLQYINARLAMAGVPPEAIEPTDIFEFKGFWQTRAHQDSRAGWHHKLVTRLIREHKKRGSHGNQTGEQRGGGDGSRQSVHREIDNTDDTSWADAQSAC